MSHLELHASGLPVFFPAAATAFVPHEGRIHAHFDARPWLVDETADEVRALLNAAPWQSICGELVAYLRQLLTTVDHMLSLLPNPAARELGELLQGMRGTILAAIERAEAP